MPAFPTPTVFPASAGTSTTGIGTSARAGGTELHGAAAPGLFAELFASMVPVSAPRQEADASVRSTTDPAVAPEDPAAEGQPAAATPQTTEAPPEGLLLAQRAHYPTLAPVEATPDAAAPGSTDMAPTTNEPASPGQTEIPTAQAPDLRAGSDPVATGSAARASFPVAVAPLPTVPVPGAPTPETAAPPQAPALPVAVAPLLTLPLSGGPTPETAAPPLPVAKAPLLVIELPESADSAPGAPQLLDSAVEQGSPDARQPAPTATLPATSPGSATVQGTAPVKIHPEVPETGSDTSEPSIPAGDGPRAGGGPAPAAAGVVLADPAPSVVPPALVTAPGIPVHAVGQATDSGPAVVARQPAGVGVGAIDALEAPQAQTAQARTQAPLPLHRQLFGPIATLAAGPNGERTLSVNIAPEALGPITVKAHLGSEGIRMDLSAPTEAGREALRAMLPELRRELAASGGGNITLNTSADGSSSGGSPRGEAFGGGGEQRAASGPRSTVLPGDTGEAPEFQAQPELPTHRATSHLDVMA
ncbi:hypothetical protein DQ353_07665 [Arthrobacter sp. AQ5-05]|nr:hypothetical protein DQ353_07665 [Arthrobacter sp. AQ5-05]